MRAFFILARASNLPTVWSNCLAAWMLAGGGDWKVFAWLCVGASLLYTGGMFLNDAFDADFDREYRKERPIPSGAIATQTVWTSGFILLIAGAGCLVWIGKSTAILTVLLAGCILIYDAIHKFTVLAPVIMAACRFLLYLVVASAAGGINGFILWSAVVLAAYVAGLSYIARAESGAGVLRFWPCGLLVAPIVLAMLVNDFAYRNTAILFAVILGARTVWSLRYIFVKQGKDIGKAVSGLLAGIVWVDMLAVNDGTPKTVGIFVGLFLLARFFQRIIPAT